MQERNMPACPVCLGTGWKDAYSVNGWRIVECGACGFARIDPMPAQESRPELYSEEKVVGRNTKVLSPTQKISRAFKGSFRKITNRDKSRIFYDRLCRFLPRGSKVLDIGCGDGSFLRTARERFSVSGVEISKYLAGLARDSGLEVFTGDFADIDLGKGSYDGVTMISLLEHIHDSGKALAKCHEALKSGGVLLLKTVNYGCINRAAMGPKWTGFRPPDHVVYFDPKNLRAFLRKKGFDDIKISAWPLSDNMYCSARKRVG